MTKGNVTSIVVAGDVDGLDQDRTFLENLSRWLPRNANAYVFTNGTAVDFNYLRMPYIEAPKFYSYSKNVLGSLHTGDIFHFIQVGHGSEGPELILERGLGSKGIFNGELASLFADSLLPEEHPFISIIMHGCFSGGFARYFWDDKGSEIFVPDFFLGASPPGGVAWITPMPFVNDSREKCDLNKDAVLTLREMGICFLNGENNHFGIVFSKSGSPDISIDGTPAKKPYFPKSVERLTDHDKFIETLETLRFGEQMVVLFEGGSADKKLSLWFEQEALTGDGYYKFVVLPDNPESRKFFKTDVSSVYVLGPNIVYAGERLKEYVPIGDQIPFVLSTQIVYVVMKDWLHKLTEKERNLFDVNLIKVAGDTAKNSEEVLNKINVLISSDKTADAEQGLLYLSTLLDMRVIYKLKDDLKTNIIALSSRFADGKIALGEQSKQTLFKMMRMLPDDQNTAELATKIRKRLNKGEEVCIINSGLPSDKFQEILKSLRTGETNSVKAAADSLKCARLDTDQNKELAKELRWLVLSDNAKEIKWLAVALMGQFSIQSNFDDEELYKKLMSEEIDDNTLTYFLYLRRFSKEIEFEDYEKRLRKVASDATNPASEQAKELVEEIDRRKKENKEKYDKFIAEKDFDLRIAGGYGALIALSNGNYETAGLSYYGSAPLQHVLLVNDDVTKAFYAGVRPTLAIDLTWKRGWASLMAGAEGFFKFDKTQFDQYRNMSVLSFILAGGAAVEYNPVQDYESVDLGWTTSLEIKSSRALFGAAFRTIYFPDRGEFIGTAGVITDMDL